MQGRYFLGVDGGQSHTLAVLAGETGRLLGAGSSGPVNHVNEPGGRERCRRAITAAVEGAFVSAGVRKRELAAAGFGMTGASELVPDIIKDVARVGRLDVRWDGETSLMAGTLGMPGVVVAAGTGAIAYGVNAGGKHHLANGWGNTLGDQGSAYDIGREAIRQALKAHDGRGGGRRLLSELLSWYGCDDFVEIAHKVYSGDIARTEIAGAARLVSRLASQGDAASVLIIKRAARELAGSAVAVLRRLGMLGGNPLVVTMGGVFDGGPVVFDPFQRRVRLSAPGARVEASRFPSVVGGLLFAFKQDGVGIDDSLLCNIEAGLSSLRAQEREAGSAGRGEGMRSGLESGLSPDPRRAIRPDDALTEKNRRSRRVDDGAE